MSYRTLAKEALRLNADHERRSGLALPPLLLLSDEARLPDPVSALDRLPPGSAVVLRHYGCTGRADLARRLRVETRKRRLKLLVAGDLALARAVGADGLHLPEGIWRRLRPITGLPPGWIVTVAAHSFPALIEAARWGAEAALISPVFATKSHIDARPLGVTVTGRWARGAPLPLYALGGISSESAPRLRALPMAGLAAVGAFA